MRLVDEFWNILVVFARRVAAVVGFFTLGAL
jgi:hypothetical protein